MKDLKLKNLKRGEIFTKNGFTIYWCAGSIALTAFRYFGKFATIKEVKEEIKNILKNQKPLY
jgi:hypothetical protein